MTDLKWPTCDLSVFTNYDHDGKICISFGKGGDDDVDLFAFLLSAGEANALIAVLQAAISAEDTPTFRLNSVKYEL